MTLGKLPRVISRFPGFKKVSFRVRLNGVPSRLAGTKAILQIGQRFS